MFGFRLSIKCCTDRTHSTHLHISLSSSCCNGLMGQLKQFPMVSHDRARFCIFQPIGTQAQPHMWMWTGPAWLSYFNLGINTKKLVLCFCLTLIWPPHLAHPISINKNLFTQLQHSPNLIISSSVLLSHLRLFLSVTI